MSRNVFQDTGAARVRRSSFDLSHRVTTAFYPGQLVPLPPIECVPGDVHKLGFNGVVRLTPLVTPAMQPMKLRYYAYFVPYRILDDNWEEFITKGEDGTSVVTLPVFNPADADVPANAIAVGTIWDYFGYPLVQPPAAFCPLDYPRRAYLKIWNEYFRVPGIQDEVVEDVVDLPASYQLRWRNWTRDYFQACLPWTQRGLSPALPVFGSTNAEFAIPDATSGSSHTLLGIMTGSSVTPGGGSYNGSVIAPAGGNLATLNSVLSDNNTIDGSGLSGADIADYRTALQLQVWLERNARAGARYTEQLQSHFDIRHNLDARLQRPEFIGGSVTDVVISEVQQTSETAATPQGTLAGHGLSLPRGFVGKYRVPEHGVIIHMVCVTPEASYSQGIDRAWLRRTTFDFPFPEFVALGEQEVFNGELFTEDSVADPTGAINFTPFGYTGRYNELRFIPNRVTGEMRPGELYEQWTSTREYASLPPLNDSFLSMETALSDMMRPFAVQNEPPCLAIFGIRLDSSRCIPYMSEPAGLPGGG